MWWNFIRLWANKSIYDVERREVISEWPAKGDRASLEHNGVLMQMIWYGNVGFSAGGLRQNRIELLPDSRKEAGGMFMCSTARSFPSILPRGIKLHYSQTRRPLIKVSRAIEHSQCHKSLLSLDQQSLHFDIWTPTCNQAQINGPYHSSQTSHQIPGLHTLHNREIQSTNSRPKFPPGPHQCPEVLLRYLHRLFKVCPIKSCEDETKHKVVYCRARGLV